MASQRLIPFVTYHLTPRNLIPLKHFGVSLKVFSYLDAYMLRLKTSRRLSFLSWLP